jgi:hypothetical protein
MCALTTSLMLPSRSDCIVGYDATHGPFEMFIVNAGIIIISVATNMPDTMNIKSAQWSLVDRCCGHLISPYVNNLPSEIIYKELTKRPHIYFLRLMLRKTAKGNSCERMVYDTKRHSSISYNKSPLANRNK